jgi:hypothetical protein
MKKILALITCLCILPVSGKALEPLSSADIALEVLLAGLYIIDWGQTLDIADRRDEGYYEINPIIGNHPTRGRVNAVFAAFAAGQVAGTFLLPTRYKIGGYLLNPRRMWQLGFISVSAACAVNNYSIGLRAGF